MIRTAHRLRATGLALGLALALTLVACGGDDPAPEGGPTSQAPSDRSATDQLIDVGLEQVESQEYARATGTFESVLALDPDNVFAHYNLGFIAQASGDELGAVERYGATLERDPEFGPALYNLAMLTEADDLEAAVELYRRTIAIEPENAAAHLRLGFALRHLGQEQEASELLDRGVELDPAMAEVTSPTYP